MATTNKITIYDSQGNPTTYDLKDDVSGYITSSAVQSGYVAKVSGKGLSTNDYTTTEKNKLSGIENNANNYSLPTASSSTKGGIKVGSNLSMSGDTLNATDTKYTAGTNVQISGSNVISATDTTYSAGTNITINSSNQISATDTKYTAGTNVSISASNVISATDTTYNDVTTSAHGLMTASDKVKLNGIEENANNYSLPTASTSTLGGVKVDGTTITITNGVISSGGGGISYEVIEIL